MSKCPWARHLTPNCSWWAGWYLAWQPIAVGCVNVCVNGWMRSIDCTALWMKALYKCQPFYHLQSWLEKKTYNAAKASMWLHTLTQQKSYHRTHRSEVGICAPLSLACIHTNCRYQGPQQGWAGFGIGHPSLPLAQSNWVGTLQTTGQVASSDASKAVPATKKRVKMPWITEQRKLKNGRLKKKAVTEHLTTSEHSESKLLYVEYSDIPSDMLSAVFGCSKAASELL